MRGNVRAFVQMAAEAFSFAEPVLEIGSRPAKGQEALADLRPLFPNKRYFGSDFLPGPSVDLLLDTHLLGVADGSVGSVVMMDTIEHVQDPLLALREVHRALRPGGTVILSSHMNFPIHNHPWDYWRFTPAALDLLLHPFLSRAVWCQSDPLAPHTVLAAAQKTSTEDEEVAFEASVAALEESWPKEIEEGPLIRFEPLLEVFVRDHDAFAQSTRSLVELIGGSRIDQTFTCPADRLTRIDLKFTPHGRMSFSSVAFRLEDEETQQTVAELQYYAPHIRDRVWVPFRFPPIPDSAGRRYRLLLGSPDSRSGAAVSPIVADGPAAPGEVLLENGRPVDGALCFRVLCRAGTYRPADYRRLAGVHSLVEPEPGAASLAEDGIKQISVAQSRHLWYAVARVNERFDRMAERIDALEEHLRHVAADVKDVLLFVQSLRASPPYKLYQVARRLLKR